MLFGENVLYCYMYINKNNEDNTDQPTPNPTEAMHLLMDYLWDKFITPAYDDLDEDDHAMLAFTGLTLEAIAEMATLYEQEEQRQEGLNFSTQWERN